MTPAREVRTSLFCCFTHGSPDGHNGTQGLSRSLSLRRFGYSTFAYPVRYSYKRDVRTFLFRPYQYLLSLILPFSQKQDLTDAVTLKAGGWLPRITTFPPGWHQWSRDRAKLLKTCDEDGPAGQRTAV